MEEQLTALQPPKIHVDNNTTVIRLLGLLIIAPSHKTRAVAMNCFRVQIQCYNETFGNPGRLQGRPTA